MDLLEGRTPGERYRVQALCELAKQEFATISEIDKRVLASSVLGEIADFGYLDTAYKHNLFIVIAAESNALQQGAALPDRPKPPACVCEKLLVWLLTSEAAQSFVHHRGIRLDCVQINSTLQLAHSKLTRPLWIVNSDLAGGIDLRNTVSRELILSRTHTKPGTMLSGSVASVMLDGAKIGGDVFLRDGFLASGTVRMIGASIHGQLSCTGGYFLNPNDIALGADDVQIKGGVFLNNTFKANGEVRFNGARIGGSLECDGGQFRNVGGAALMADLAQIDGGVSLGGHFGAHGEVRLAGATIGGGLVCANGKFHNAEGSALVVDEAHVGRNVYLTEGFEARGEVRLLRATIGSDLRCVGGTFLNKGGSGTAIHLYGTNIGGMLNLCDMRELDGIVDLTSCRIGVLFDGWKQHYVGTQQLPNGVLLSDCRYEAIFSESPLDSSSRLKWLGNYDLTLSTWRLWRAFNHGGVSPVNEPDPQPYRWLAEVMKKQGHEDEARTVLRVCAKRRMIPLVRRAYREGPTFPLRHLFVWAVVAVFAVILLRLAEQNRAASVITHAYIGWGIIFVAMSFLRDDKGSGLRDVARVVEAIRVAITQLLYFVVVGHGYARWRAAGCALALVVLGVAVFRQDSKEIMQPAQAVALRATAERDREETRENEWVAKYPKFDPVIYSIDTLLPLVSFHQEDHWTPSGRGKWGWFVKNVYLPLHISAGWVIATLFVASFTRLMRQEG